MSPALFIPYALAWLYAARRIAWEAYDPEEPTNLYDDRCGIGGATLSGLVCGFFWPIIAVGLAGLWLSENHKNGLIKVLMHEPSRERKERQIASARARIAELEQELGL